MQTSTDQQRAYVICHMKYWNLFEVFEENSLTEDVVWLRYKRKNT